LDTSTTAGTVDFVFAFIIGVSVFFLALITFLMIFFIIKYNKKRHTKPKDIPGNTALEILWTVIPTILVLVMFFLGWKGFTFLRSAPENALTIDVTARMWSWLFEYEGGVQTDTLYVPVNTPVKLLLHSQDVIHSFFMPAFRVKEDAVPGLENYLWFEAKEVGDYDVLCAEYCGLRHAYMYTKVRAVPQQTFDTWYADMAKNSDSLAYDETETDQRTVERKSFAGERLIVIKGCKACHSSDGSKMIGPTFKGLYNREQRVLVDGVEKSVKVDEQYLRRSIIQPNVEVVKGYSALMPSQEGMITEEELVSIIQYLKQL
jgi:cytochrome c oxidase subunit 2